MLYFQGKINLKYIEVALNVPLNQTFTYSSDPAEKAETVQEELIPEKKRQRKQISYECAPGKRVMVPFGNRRLIGLITAVHDSLKKSCPIEQGKIRPIIRVMDEEPLLPDELIQLGKWMAVFYLCNIGEALISMIPSGKKESDAGGFSMADETSFSQRHQLSEEQEKAVAGITEEPAAGSRKKIHYLYGGTGSGKTEVFLQAAEKVLNDGKGVIYLVPEIALTAQVIESVVQRFGQTVAVLHSGLTPSQKLSEWKRIQKKEARVVIGARSAIFAPVPDLGLIIIDEEHDSSYKSGNTPRYHARQVAMYRASRLDIPLVMGSATPSVEAWYSIRSGIFRSHVLTRRLAGGKMPEIKCIDLNIEKPESGSISKPLCEEIRSTLNEKRQVILFLNRRGFNHFFRCASCGFEMSCKNCSVPLTYHKSQNRLRCHYCGWSAEPPHSCPECGSMDIGYSGFGTEFIESEVKSKFPNARVIRVDTDSLTKKGELQEKIDAFRNGEYDIMLGTQMIAKGLNFPNLKLVGVILADTTLHLPDFRAAEKTFSLITQVAGRAGRFFPDGKVLVQTYTPGVQAIYYACNGKTDEFYSSETDIREMLSFPPFSRLIRLVFRSASEKSAGETAASGFSILSAKLEELKQKHVKGAEGTEILGPSECPLSKISNNYRHQILLRGKSIAVLQNIAADLIYGYTHPQDVYIESDVDPVNLL